MGLFRKAYSIVGALLLLDVLVQFFLIAAIFTVYSEAGNGTPAQRALDDSGFYFFAHALNGAALAIFIILMVGFSFGARYAFGPLPALPETQPAAIGG